MVPVGLGKLGCPGHRDDDVQFFESLFRATFPVQEIAQDRQKRRDLRRGPDAPVPLLKPCLEAIRELSLTTERPSCCALLPSPLSTSEFNDGLEGVREITPDPDSLSSFRKGKVDTCQHLAIKI